MDANAAVALARRGRAKLGRMYSRAELQARARLHGGQLVVDYGWGKLAYAVDGDGQEVAYYQNADRWHEKDQHVFRSLLAPGQTAIDVGANSGFITLILAQLVGSAGRVLSFEPSPIVFKKLERTIAVNQLQQVEPINLGCGSEVAVKQLNRVSDSTGNSSIVAPGSDPTEIHIKPLDDVELVWEHPVSLLKIDTEGYEPEVLRGAKRLLAEQRPIVYLEMGGDYVDSTLQSIELLDEAGYGVDHVRQLDWTAIGNGSDFFFWPRPQAQAH